MTLSPTRPAELTSAEPATRVSADGPWRRWVPPAAAVAVTLAVWLPSIVHAGNVFTRDPSLFGSVGADFSWSVGTFSFRGGTSTIANQGLFYEPYGLLIALLHLSGLSAAALSKLVPIGMTLAAFVGAYALLGDLSADTSTRWLGAAFFVANPWSLDTFGYFYIWTGYCLLPALVLAVLRMARGERTPPWMPVALLFLGGIIAWGIAALVAVTTLLVTRPTKRVWGRMAAWFIVASLFWLPAYGLWLAGGGGSVLRYSSTGGVLQSSHPLLDLLGMRDFWWPHLVPSNQVGALWADVARAGATLLVACALLVAIRRSPREGPSTTLTNRRALPRRSSVGTLIAALLLVGFVLGAGTSGITGPLYRFIHDAAFFGHGFVASAMREPANLAGPFVLGVSMAVGLGPARRERGTRVLARRLPYPGAGQRGAWVAIVGILVVATCVPSLLTFWAVYQPITVPRGYHAAAATVRRGTVMQVGYWDIASVSPNGGVWRFRWSTRMVADPTVLASYADVPTLAPTDPAVAKFELDSIGASPGPISAREIVATAERLGVGSLMIENDLQRPPADQQRLASFIASVRALGLPTRHVGPTTLVSLPGSTRGPLWSNRCALSDSLMWLGAVHVHCRAGGGQGAAGTRLVSPFTLTGPFVAIGVRLGHPHAVVHGVGTEAAVSGRSGWIVAPAQLAAVLGALIAFGVVGGFGLIRLALAARRHLRGAERDPEQVREPESGPVSARMGTN